MQQAHHFTGSPPVRTPLKRSNALRIKSGNLELLPLSLKESLMVLRKQLSSESRAAFMWDCAGECQEDGAEEADEEPEADGEDEPEEEEQGEEEEDEEEELRLLDQIRRGVKLRPVDSTESRKKSEHYDSQTSLSKLLLKVLRQRYEAIQQTDDESDSGSVDHEPPLATSHAIQYDYNSLSDDPDLIRSRSRSIKLARTKAGRSLLVELDEYSRRNRRDMELKNDLTIRL